MMASGWPPQAPSSSMILGAGFAAFLPILNGGRVARIARMCVSYRTDRACRTWMPTHTIRARFAGLNVKDRGSSPAAANNRGNLLRGRSSTTAKRCKSWLLTHQDRLLQECPSTWPSLIRIRRSSGRRVCSAGRPFWTPCRSVRTKYSPSWFRIAAWRWTPRRRRSFSKCTFYRVLATTADPASRWARVRRETMGSLRITANARQDSPAATAMRGSISANRILARMACASIKARDLHASVSLDLQELAATTAKDCRRNRIVEDRRTGIDCRRRRRRRTSGAARRVSLGAIAANRRSRTAPCRASTRASASRATSAPAGKDGKDRSARIPSARFSAWMEPFARRLTSAPARQDFEDRIAIKV